MLGYYINLTPRRVFDLCPPLLKKERGKNSRRGASPLFNSPLVSLSLKGEGEEIKKEGR